VRTARVLVLAGAGTFALCDWFWARLNRALEDGQEPFRKTVDDMLSEDPPVRPW
jgi:hypothetical protein